jgi:predicted glycosyltransferase
MDTVLFKKLSTYIRTRPGISANQLIAWMRKLGLTSKLKPNKNQVVERKLTPQEEIKQLKDQLKQTQKTLSDAQMMNGYYQQVIEVAEREFRIEIEKKFDTKQSKK